MGSEPLGKQLRDVRLVRGLKAVAELAGISDTYLHNLERGKVANPSPHNLHRLGEVLDVSYVVLMRSAGYAMEDQEEGDQDSQTVLAQALSTEPLTRRRHVRDFIGYLRYRRGAL